MDPSKQQHILIIDNHPEHVETVKQTLAQAGCNCKITAIAQIEEAVKYFHRQGEYHAVPRPHLVLLDPDFATTPIQEGLTVLSTIKNEPFFKRTPVVVLTLSDEKRAIFDSYRLQGNCYVLKSSSLEHLASIVKKIEEFWLGVVTLPNE